MRGGRPGWFAFFALLVLSMAPASASPGGVHVSTLPAGADVWIDGTYVGRSPLIVEGLEQGRHTLTVTKTGWTSQELPVDIPSEAIAMTGVRLIASGAKGTTAMGSCVIRKLPPGAHLTIDGRPVAADAHEFPLPAGVHRLTIALPRGSTIAQTFVVYPETATALAMLDAAPASARAAVIAQASDYLPDGNYNVSGGRFMVHHAGHEVAGTIGATTVRFDGVSIAYDSAPAIIDGRLYLPLALLEKLTGHSAKPK